MMNGCDTIAAITTAAGCAGVSVIRISGCTAWETGISVARLPQGFKPQANTFRHVEFCVHGCDTSIDDGIILFFRAPHSYTGEDVVEIQGHGGKVAPQRLLHAVLDAGARLAAPGEFTKRAFLNGKIDLTQAEAVMDLIESRTDRAASAARMRLDGALGGRVNAISDSLIDIQASVEHLLDFDENEVPVKFCDDSILGLNAAASSIEDLLSNWRMGQLLRDGALAVISGLPNAGKSSLMNALLGRDRSIVSAIPGTTRDTIEESISINGVAVRLVDTAGIHGGVSDIIEAEGIARAGALLREADINVRVLDAASSIRDEELDAVKKLSPANTIVVFNKVDVAECLMLSDFSDYRTVKVSAKTGVGLSALRDVMSELLGDNSACVAGTEISERHMKCLKTALLGVHAASECLKLGAEGLVLAAQQLNIASESLSEITGRSWSEELLDAVFSKFCVGK